MGKLIDGKQIAADIRSVLKEEISKLTGRKPGLAFILVGDDPASMAYVRMKEKGCHETGIISKILKLPMTITQDKLLAEITALNEDDTIDGILVQQPLPSQICLNRIVEAVHPGKDVDGFHPMNIGKLLLGHDDGLISCTPLGIMKLLEKAKIDPAGKHVVILGRSNIVGKPLAALLMQKKAGANATVTVAHSRSQNLSEITLSADILIAALGKPHFVKKEMIKEGAIVIDVGINRENNHLVGDVDLDDVLPKCSRITPVPGGVGPMTIAMLLSNTLHSFQQCVAS